MPTQNFIKQGSYKFFWKYLNLITLGIKESKFKDYNHSVQSDHSKSDGPG
jgi:hypothetical protein